MNHQSDRRDAAAVRMLPWLIVACLVATFALTIFRQNYDFWMFINRLCTIFAIGFAVLGAWAVPYLNKGPFPLWLLTGVFVIALVVAWALFTGSDDVLYLGGLDAYQTYGSEYLTVFRALDLILTLFIMVMAPIGILTTISAMLRKYIPRLLLSVERGTDKGKNPAAKFFGVPDVLDIEEVEVDPEDEGNAVDLDSFIWLGTYTFSLGILVCSMLFLNPIILETVSKDIIIRAMITLTLVLPALVTPWLCIKSVGAKAISVAPRPYYLWKGARKKLFLGFVTLGLFFFSFLISVYYGNTVWTIVSYYLEYLIPAAAITFVTSLVYANYFSKTLRDGVCEDFLYKKRL